MFPPRPSRRTPGRRSDGPGQGPVKPESTGFGPIPGKTRGFLADTTVHIKDSSSIGPPVKIPGSVNMQAESATTMRPEQCSTTH